MQPVIRVRNVSKLYRVGALKPARRDLRETLAEIVAAPLRRWRFWNEYDIPKEEQFWALQDVNFDVHHGEVVGLMGRNGSGKSTLLKILAQVTEPTTGRIELFGRVGSLLEVGTGFHHELTGRENVYLNGAHLGLSRRVVKSVFDEIVDFSEVGRFIDTPVKRYSSGMYVRLAFAVAAFLRPDVLIVDEVLAVGDIHFKQKCLQKIGEVAKQGSTIFLVSHSPGRIKSLCDRVFLLDQGRMVYDGTPEDVLERYYTLSGRTEAQTETAAVEELPATLINSSLRKDFLLGFQVLNAAGEPTDAFTRGETIRFALEVDTQGERYDSPLFNIVVRKREAWACTLYTRHMIEEPFSLCGKHRLECEWEPGDVTPGDYVVDVIIKDRPNNGKAVVREQSVGSFTLADPALDGYEAPLVGYGIMMPRGRWRISRLERAAA